MYRLPLFIVFLSCCTTACKEEPEVRIERYENGQISRKSTLVNGKKEGLMTDYYNNGSLMAERHFQNGLQQGRTVIYYPGGKLKEVQHYLNGKKDGGDTLWYENGSIQFVSTLKEDKLHGYLRKWATDGQMIYEARYDMDTLVEVKGAPVQKSNTSAIPSAILKKKE